MKGTLRILQAKVNAGSDPSVSSLSYYSTMPQTGWLEQQTSIFLEAGKSKNEESADLVSVRALSWLQMSVFSLCPPRKESREEAALCLSSKGTAPSHS